MNEGTEITNLQIFLIAVPLWLILSFIIFMIINSLVYGRRSIPYKSFLYFHSRITKQEYLTKEDVKKENHLYVCKECDSLIRSYQVRLIEESGRGICCPHCNKEYDRMVKRESLLPKFPNYVLELRSLPPSDFEPWMDECFDAPYKSRKELQVLYAKAKEMKRLAYEMRSIDKYKEYSKKELSNWTENIFKGYKED